MATDEAEIRHILEQSACVRLGLNDGGRVYIVPMNFGFDYDGGALTLYFHSAGEGRKIDLLRKTRRAAFEMDCDLSLQTGRIACEYSEFYRSLMGEGTVEFLEDGAEKRRALDKIMLHAAGKDGWTYPESMVRRVCIFTVTATELSCKAHRRPAE
ncbi:MAG: pyridoxamine 5'-phosphate oxidase family protein [Treponemataceae bacterium]|nr:pyridoxamine 5'-phosphate oxidase family protein [Treponemataceae bacterium]